VPVLQQAGLTDVKIVGILGLAENLQYIRDGQSQTADAAWDNNYMGWAIMDQWFREVAGQPLASPAGENIPEVLIDKSNVGTSKGGWATSIDYKSKYLQLWGQN
jgi:ribose transport system substrate-binding protein